MKERVYFLISMLFTLMILALIGNNHMPTGYATFASPDQVQTALNVLSTDGSMELLAEGVEICAVVEISSETTYYYSIIKTGPTVDMAEEYCADPGQDNLIIKFNSFDDLLSASKNPKAFIAEKMNTGYYIFPSNYVSIGGESSCPASFQQNYCAALYVDFSKTEIADMGLACCANYELTAEQQAKVDEVKKGKAGSLQSPMDFLFSTTGIIIIIMVIIFIVIVSSLVVLKPKNPLVEYVHTTRMQGYADEDIKNSLVQSGWDEKTIDDALTKK